MWSSDDLVSASVNCIKLNICQLWHCEINVSAARFIKQFTKQARLILFSRIYFEPNQLTISQTNWNKPVFFGKLVLWNSPQLWKKCKRTQGLNTCWTYVNIRAGLHGTCFCKCLRVTVAPNCMQRSSFKNPTQGIAFFSILWYCFVMFLHLKTWDAKE